jgi:hypothetical protein
VDALVSAGGPGDPRLRALPTLDSRGPLPCGREGLAELRASNTLAVWTSTQSPLGLGQVAVEGLEEAASRGAEEGRQSPRARDRRPPRARD